MAERRTRVSVLYCKGISQQEIAEQLGLTRGTVYEDIVLLHKEWQESRIWNVARARAGELQRIDRVESEAWKAWERSLGEVQTVSARTTPDGKVSSEIVKRQQNGDPRFLEVAMRCIERRCRILGIDAAVKIDLQGDEPENPFLGAARQMTDEQVNALIVLGELTKQAALNAAHST